MRRIAAMTTRRPGRTLLAVAAFVVLAAAFGGRVAGELRTSGGFTAEDSDSTRAEERIQAATGLESAPAIVLIVARARAGGLRQELTRVPGVARVDRERASRDGRSVLLAATLRADADESRAVAVATERFGGRDGVDLGGGQVANEQVGDSVTSDLGRAEALAFPVILLLSLVFFRGRAAVMPLLVGLTTVLGTLLVLAQVNRVYGLSIFSLNLVIGLGLGLAIDYTLFLVTRFREELARDPGDTHEAVRVTLATAGRTVVFSAVTVAVSLLTLVLFPLNFLASMGIAGAVVALTAGAASLLIAPALFVRWGPKLLVAPRRRGAGGWYRLAHAVMRRPGTVAVVTALLMLAAGAPALRAQWTPVDKTVIPTDQSSRTVADRLDAEFPGQRTDPIRVVTATAPTGLAGVDGVASAGAPRRLDDRTWVTAVLPEGLTDGERAHDAVRALRAAVPGALVGGSAAEFVDQQDAIGSRLLPAAVVLAVVIFIVLWLMTGSVLLPVKALVMNLLTVAASLGVLTLVFQDGRLTGLLGYTPNGGVEPTDFLVAAALIFALSTDYGVFLLERIREARRTAASEREAVAVGLERTGAVVTAAAILLAVAIGAFITSSISFIQQIGVAAATGVLLDAFVVRALLVPSLMALLGRWNWWSPRPLARLHARLGAAG